MDPYISVVPSHLFLAKHHLTYLLFTRVRGWTSCPHFFISRLFPLFCTSVSFNNESNISGGRLFPVDLVDKAGLSCSLFQGPLVQFCQIF
jgi:hypothetical protein